MAKRCDKCDAPLPTSAMFKHLHGCECKRCLAACWRFFNFNGGCQRPPYDWRAEALRLRALVKELEARDAT